MTKDRALSVGLLIFIGIMFLQTLSFPEKTTWQMFSSAFYPRIILSILTVLVILFTISAFKNKKQNSPKVNYTIKSLWNEYGKVLFLFVLTGIYISFMQLIGFLISTILFLIICQGILMGIRDKKLILMNLSISLIASFSIYFIFTRLLNVLLP